MKINLIELTNPLITDYKLIISLKRTNLYKKTIIHKSKRYVLLEKNDGKFSIYIETKLISKDFFDDVSSIEATSYLPATIYREFLKANHSIKPKYQSNAIATKGNKRVDIFKFYFPDEIWPYISNNGIMYNFPSLSPAKNRVVDIYNYISALNNVIDDELKEHKLSLDKFLREKIAFYFDILLNLKHKSNKSLPLDFINDAHDHLKIIKKETTPDISLIILSNIAAHFDVLVRDVLFRCKYCQKYFEIAKTEYKKYCSVECRNRSKQKRYDIEGKKKTPH